MEIILTIEELQRLLGTKQYESNISLLTKVGGAIMTHATCALIEKKAEFATVF